MECSNDKANNFKLDHIAGLKKEQTLSLWKPFSDFTVKFVFYKVSVIKDEESG
jgi:hypothetical protein